MITNGNRYENQICPFLQLSFIMIKNIDVHLIKSFHISFFFSYFVLVKGEVENRQE